MLEDVAYLYETTMEWLMLTLHLRDATPQAITESLLLGQGPPA